MARRAALRFPGRAIMWAQWHCQRLVANNWVCHCQRHCQRLVAHGYKGEGLLSENLEPTLLLIYSLKGRRRRRRPAAAACRLSPVLCRHRRRVSSSRVACRLSSSVVVRRRRLCCRILSSVACRLFFIEDNDNDGQTLTMMISLTAR